MNTIGTKIANKIAYYRKEKGMTQEELAGKLGVTAQAVSKWENEVACPDIQLLVPLAKVFGVTTDELLSSDTVKSVQLLPEQERRDTKELTLKVIVDSKEGDKVRINLPMELVKVALEIGTKIPQVANQEQLQHLDFEQIVAMVDRGVIGTLVEVESADGELVKVVVE